MKRWTRRQCIEYLTKFAEATESSANLYTNRGFPELAQGGFILSLQVKNAAGILQAQEAGTMSSTLWAAARRYSLLHDGHAAALDDAAKHLTHDLPTATHFQELAEGDRKVAAFLRGEVDQ